MSRRNSRRASPCEFSEPATAIQTVLERLGFSLTLYLSCPPVPRPNGPSSHCFGIGSGRCWAVQRRPSPNGP
jgi:hypothetical protein